MGVVLTAIETGKATIKAEKLMELNKDIPEYDTRQKVLDCWHFYIPAAVVGAGTIGCIVGANMLSRKEIARLSAAYMALGKTYQEYRRQVAERIGREEEQQLHASVAEEVKRDKDGDVIRLFYEPATKRYFHATMADVTQASYWFNRELMTEGCVSVNAWCDYLCSDELPFLPDGDERGWCIDQLVYDWDSYWMDFEYGDPEGRVSCRASTTCGPLATTPTTRRNSWNGGRRRTARLASRRSFRAQGRRAYLWAN